MSNWNLNTELDVDTDGIDSVDADGIDITTDTDAADAGTDTGADTGTGTSAAPSPRDAKRKRNRAGGFTKAQVLRVLDTAEVLTAATSDEQRLLRLVTKADEGVNGLVVAVLTHQVTAGDPLDELATLIDTSEQNPLMVGAMLMGMDRITRNQIHAIVAELGGDTTPLPRDELNAAVRVAEMVGSLSDHDKSLVARVRELRG